MKKKCIGEIKSGYKALFKKVAMSTGISCEACQWWMACISHTSCTRVWSPHRQPQQVVCRSTHWCPHSTYWEGLADLQGAGLEAQGKSDWISAFWPPCSHWVEWMACKETPGWCIGPVNSWQKIQVVSGGASSTVLFSMNPYGYESLTQS